MDRLHFSKCRDFAWLKGGECLLNFFRFIAVAECMYALACLRAWVIVNHRSVKKAELAGRAVVYDSITKALLGSEVLSSTTQKRVHSKGRQTILVLDSRLIQWIALVGMNNFGLS